jgi:hypothetical protein
MSLEERVPGGATPGEAHLWEGNYTARMAVNIARLRNCRQTSRSPPRGCSLPASFQSHDDGLFA